MSDRTARAIAAARAIGTDGVHDPLADRGLPVIDAAVVATARRVAGLHPVFDAWMRGASAGLTTHAARRLAAIDREVLAAVADGVRQVVVLGAGFDTRAWRLAELRGSSVFEVDRSAIQERKGSRLGGRPPLAEVRSVPADLAADDLDAVLSAAGHQPSEPTAWLWEAVTFYLPPAAVATTVACVAARSAAGSRLIATYLEPELLGGGRLERWVRPVVRSGFAAVGEPLLTTLRETQVRACLTSAGFDAVEVADLRDAARNAVPPARRDLFAAERLVVGVRGPAR